MSMLTVIWNKIRPLIDLGVSEQTKPEDVKDIRLFNVLLLLWLIVVIPFYLKQ